jgi:transposase
MFGLNPFCGAVFVFRAKRADGIKLLVWDQTGMVLVHKRLEGGRFVWPQVRDGVMRMSSAQLAALLEGLDCRLVRPERARRPQAAGRASGTCSCWSGPDQRDPLRHMDADALSSENAHLKARLAEVEAALAEVQEANRRLEDILRTWPSPLKRIHP